MKKLLLTTALCALAAPAYAKNTCSTTAVVGQNLVQIECDSDNQIKDADDLKLFLDKQAGLANLEGSLFKNNSIPTDQNIGIKATGGLVNQDGNGFAELKSSLQGSPLNTLRELTFTSLFGSIIDDKAQEIFNGFDGFIGRGQVDPTGIIGTDKKGKPIFGWDGKVFLDITFTDASTLELTYLNDTSKHDLGAFGFDEPIDPGKLITSVGMRLDDTGAWNEVKQLEFSVPNSIAGVPEVSTWGMGLMGFGLLGLGGLYRTRREARYAIS